MEWWWEHKLGQTLWEKKGQQPIKLNNYLLFHPTIFVSATEKRVDV